MELQRSVEGTFTRKERQNLNIISSKVVEGGLVQKTWQTEANLYLTDNFVGCPEPSMGSASLGELKCLLGIMVFTFRRRCFTFRGFYLKWTSILNLKAQLAGCLCLADCWTILTGCGLLLGVEVTLCCGLVGVGVRVDNSAKGGDFRERSLHCTPSPDSGPHPACRIPQPQVPLVIRPLGWCHGLAV